jgi:hypothetical protein
MSHFHMRRTFFSICYDSFYITDKILFKMSSALIGQNSAEPCLYASCFELFIFLTLKYSRNPTRMHTNPFTETRVRYLYLYIFSPRSRLIEEETQHWILNSRANVGLDWSYGLNCYVTYASETTQVTNVVFGYCSCVFNWIILNKCRSM